MNRTFLILASFTILAACSKISPPEIKEVKQNYFMECVVINDIQVTSVSGTDVFFYTDIVTIEDEGIDWYVHDSAFKSIATNGITFSPLYSERLEEQSDNNYASILMIDESEDWHKDEFISNLNRSIKGGIRSNKGKFALGLYGQNNHTGTDPVYFLDKNGDNKIFDNSYEEIITELTSYVPYSGNSAKSNLYSALNSAIDKIILENPSGEKHITLITASGNEVSSSVTYSTLLNKCISNNIKIDLIALRLPDPTLTRLVQSTGGFLMTNEKYVDRGYYQIYLPRSCAYFVNELLQENFKKHRIYCKASRSTNWLSGNQASGFIGIRYYEGDGEIYTTIDFDFVLPLNFIIP